MGNNHKLFDHYLFKVRYEDVIKVNHILKFLFLAIVNSKSEQTEDFPYQVSIEFNGHQICSGSIIASNWVLTTYKCVEPGITKRNYIVRAGTSERESDGSVHKIDKIVKHDNYDDSISYLPSNNLALARVEKPFIFDDTRYPILLIKPEKKLVPGETANFSGFGEHRDYLQSLKLTIMDSKKCNETYSNILPKGLFCAGYEDHKNNGYHACKSDEGGPLTVDNRLAGLVSYILTCDPKQSGLYPALYADVVYHREWILKTIGQ